MATFDDDFFPPEVQWTTIPGAFGEFDAPGSKVKVAYVQTFASLGSDGTGHTRITRDLLPVREIFDVGDLNFDELVQRDLDDFRVATEIIPYLVRSSEYVRFFPPILAVLVPIEGKKLSPLLPVETISPTEFPSDQTVTETTRWGQVLELHRNRKGSTYSTTATLRFNPDQSRLLVIDGQHRAMAMLAIKRSLTGDWGDRGSDFKHFYEDLAADLGDPTLLERLARVQMPICICIFPDLHAGTKQSVTITQACRRLFLDVNKNAKKPTNARIHLLDDSDLRSVLARRLLFEIRQVGVEGRGSSYALDLDCFEYDSPVASPEPRRDLAMATVEMLWEAVHWTCFAPDEYHDGIEKRPSSGKAKPRAERFLSEIRADSEIKSSEAYEWGYSDLDQEFDPENVPTSAHARLGSLFAEGWGHAIVSMYSDLHPFHAHHKAVADLRLSKRQETGHGALAYRALFDGQGIYWTLQSYAEQRRKRRRELEKLGKGLPTLSIESAFAAIRDVWIEDEFHTYRAEHFFDSKPVQEKERRSSKESYNIFRTQAFQLGVLMSFSSLKSWSEISEPGEFREACSGWIETLNQSFTRKIAGEPRGLTAFDRTWKGPDEKETGLMATHVVRLQKSEWYWFRYFVFEMMLSAEAEFYGRSEAQAALPKLREKYIRRFTAQIQAAAADIGDELSDKKARERAIDLWSSALKYSFGVKKGEFAASVKPFEKEEYAAQDTAEGSDLENGQDD